MEEEEEETHVSDEELRARVPRGVARPWGVAGRHGHLDDGLDVVVGRAGAGCGWRARGGLTERV